MTQLYGTETCRNEQVAVTTTSIEVSKYGNSPATRRKMIIITNTSLNAADIITLRLGHEAATAYNGIVLQQNQSWVDSDSEGYQCWQGKIQAICATVNGLLSIVER